MAFEINDLNNIFNAELKAERTLFDFPPKFTALKVAASGILNSIITDLKFKAQSLIQNLSSSDFLIDTALITIQNKANISEDEVRSYVRRNPTLRSIRNWAERDFYSNTASEITRGCEDKDLLTSNIANILAHLKAKNVDVNTLQQTLNSTTELKTKKPNQLYTTEKFYPWVFLVWWLLINIKEWLTTTRYPSPNRRKYLQISIRNVGSQMKAQLENYGTEAQNILSTLATVDNLLIAIGATSLVYLQNRTLGQQKSKQELETISLSETCNPIELIPEPSIFSVPFTIENFSCPIYTDAAIIPHEPIEQKLKNLNCPIDISRGDSEINANTENDIATIAIIENLSLKKDFKILIKKDWHVTPETLLGTIGGRQIYAPVSGIVTDISTNKIQLDNISDIQQNILEQTNEELNAIYEELFQIKEFVKEFYLDSWLPVLLNISPALDASGNFRKKESRAISINRIWEVAAVEQNNRAINSFNSKIESITSAENIKSKAENEDLNSIKSEFDNEENLLFKKLLLYAEAAENQAEVTYGQPNEYVLIEYFVNLLGQLNNFNDQNPIVINYKHEINKFAIERSFIDKYNLEKIISKINRAATQLARGVLFFFASPDFYNNIELVYNTDLNPKKAVREYITSIGKENKKLTSFEKEKLVDQIVYLFLFTREILDLQNQEKEYIPENNKYQQTVVEAKYIKEYFDSLWVKLNEELPSKIKELEIKIDALARSFVPPIIRVNAEGKQYQWYGLEGPKRECPLPPEDDPYLTPYTAIGLGDLRYWLKYCSFATLASAVNPAFGWSTGLLTPVGPIQLPTVYLPFKSFETKWGFIVIGLTITGIYLFPWVLFTNYSTNYNTPFGDPTVFIKQEIEALKTEITRQKINFKQNILKNYLNRTKEQIITLNNEIDKYKDLKIEHQTNRPRKPRFTSEIKAREKIKANAEYALEYKNWLAQQVSYTEHITSLKVQKFLLEQKYNITYSTFVSDQEIESDDATILSFKQQQQKIVAQLDQLNGLVEKLNTFLKRLPITMQPSTANFGFTVKNPKIINKWATELDDNVNQNQVNKIVKQFKLKGNDFMETKFQDRTLDLTFSKYKNKLKLSRAIIIKKDPFPKYEFLSFDNIAWLKFLYTEWVPNGAKTFGFPGFPPLPI